MSSLRVPRREAWVLPYPFLRVRAPEMKCEITPIYGNGWTNGFHTIETPSPFCLVNFKSESTEIVNGNIESDDLDLNGAKFQASLRALGGSTYNCQININSYKEEHTKDGKLHGYCYIKVS